MIKAEEKVMKATDPQPTDTVSFKQIRCNVCSSLLCKVSPESDAVIEIPCRRCKTMRVIKIHFVLVSASNRT